jgi:hypothetical protein
MKKPGQPFKSTHPVHINSGFKCENCGKDNLKATKTCRNHCSYCLFSKHVDGATPGDRLSKCGGLMEPITVDYKAKKSYQIIHRCIKCGTKKINKIAEDDNLDELNRVMRNQNSINPED